MTDNDRNQNQDAGSSTKGTQNPDQSTQNASSQQEQSQNPQKGTKWSNYRSREMSDEGYSGENIAEQENK
jgi:hypothetical protein